MGRFKGLIAFFTLLLLTCGLGLTAFSLANHELVLRDLLLIQLQHCIGGYFFLGVGLSLPLVLLGTLLGWLQIILLINGSIAPHLAREGFLKALGTLSQKI